MSSALIAKLRKTREFGIEAGGFKFTARRPTDVDAIELGGIAPVEFVKRFVVGWSLTELDVIPGGGPEPVAFDSELWAEWIADRPDLWEPLAIPIMDAYRKHVEQREAAAKN
jgi:hypothetical protein